MHRYSPSKEQVRREWLRNKRKKKYKHQRTFDIPDNSEPWLLESPQTVKELISICDEIAKLEVKWKKTPKNY